MGDDVVNKTTRLRVELDLTDFDAAFDQMMSREAKLAAVVKAYNLEKLSDARKLIAEEERMMTARASVADREFREEDRNRAAMKKARLQDARDYVADEARKWREVEFMTANAMAVERAARQADLNWKKQAAREEMALLRDIETAARAAEAGTGAATKAPWLKMGGFGGLASGGGFGGLTFSGAGAPYATAALMGGQALYNKGREGEESEFAASRLSAMSGGTMDDAYGKAKKLSNELGISIPEAAEAMGAALQKGIPADVTDRFVKSANAVAMMSGTDLRSVVGMMGAIKNDYEMDSKQFSTVPDKLIAATKGGVPLDELVSQIGQTSEVTKEAGIKFEEVLGLFADFAQKGVSPSQAKFALKDVAQHIIHPGEAALKEQDRLGFHPDAAMVEERGLAQTLKDLDKVMKEQGSDPHKALGIAEGVRGAGKFWDILTDTATIKAQVVNIENSGGTAAGVNNQLMSTPEMERRRAYSRANNTLQGAASGILDPLVDTYNALTGGSSDLGWRGQMQMADVRQQDRDDYDQRAKFEAANGGHKMAFHPEDHTKIVAEMRADETAKQERESRREMDEMVKSVEHLRHEYEALGGVNLEHLFSSQERLRASAEKWYNESKTAGNALGKFETGMHDREESQLLARSTTGASARALSAFVRGKTALTASDRAFAKHNTAGAVDSATEAHSAFGSLAGMDLLSIGKSGMVPWKDISGYADDEIEERGLKGVDATRRRREIYNQANQMGRDVSRAYQKYRGDPRHADKDFAARYAGGLEREADQKEEKALAQKQDDLDSRYRSAKDLNEYIANAMKDQAHWSAITSANFAAMDALKGNTVLDPKTKKAAMGQLVDNINYAHSAMTQSSSWYEGVNQKTQELRDKDPAFHDKFGETFGAKTVNHNEKIDIKITVPPDTPKEMVEELVKAGLVDAIQTELERGRSTIQTSK
jgi:TP901 family phage tail tape measure protein